MRIAEALAVGTQELAQRGIERPEIEARLILGDVLRCSSVGLIVNNDLVGKVSGGPCSRDDSPKNHLLT